MRRLPRRTLLRAGASSGVAALLGPLQPKSTTATSAPGSSCCGSSPCHDPCAGHQGCQQCGCPQSDATLCPPPLSQTGACVPLALGRKHKNGLDAKLQPILHDNAVPSVLAATVFQQARRYALGNEPANQLETAAFEVFRSLTSDVQAVLRCSLDLLDALPTADRDRILAPEVLNRPDQSFSVDELVPLVQEELRARAAVATFGDPTCVDERPGLQRPIPGNEGDINFFPGICRINRLRTTLSVDDLGSLTSEELQQVCVDDVVNGEVATTCEVQTADCPGDDIEGTCLRVQEIPAGGGVTLEGVNYYDTSATVLLTAKAPGTEEREVEAHVCGDLTTPATEMIGEGEFAITDCRVQDQLAFRVPEDLPEGIYDLRVFATDASGRQWSTPPPGPMIRVVPSPTAGFQIAAEELECVEETSPGWAGSDEVGLRVNVVPLSLDFSPGAMASPFGPSGMRFGDVDSDNTRRINQSVFREAGIGGVVISIAGFEIDDDEAYEKQIQGFADAFEHVLKSNWQLLSEGIGGVGGAVATALISTGWGLAIGAAIALAINIGLALWAPADLIIEDTLAFRASDLAALTSPNFPIPAIPPYTSPGGIDVTVEPISKGAQYVERREYKSGDSTYRLTIRHNRM